MIQHLCRWLSIFILSGGLLTAPILRAADLTLLNVSAESILAEPPVALVDKVVDQRGTRPVAQAYLDYLYSDEGQPLIGKHFYRPGNPAIAARLAEQFPAVKRFTNK